MSYRPSIIGLHMRVSVDYAFRRFILVFDLDLCIILVHVTKILEKTK